MVCGVWSVEFGVWSVECVECGVWSVESVECVECGVWSVRRVEWGVVSLTRILLKNNRGGKTMRC